MTAAVFNFVPELGLDLYRAHSRLTPAWQERTKVAALFAGRRIVANMQMGRLDSETQQTLLERLRSLQAAIYRLDRYGESNWKVEEAILRELWQPICDNLRSFYPTDVNVENAVREIRAYQQIEVGLRHGHDPTAIPIHQFYSLKTCDVRLSRRLIVMISGNEVLETLTPFWNFYDLASEVCDDLTDIREDSRDFNCNRFLICRVLLGDEKTGKQYSQFLDLLLERTVLLWKSSCGSVQPKARPLFEWTLDAIRRARLLLHRYLAADYQLLLKLPIMRGIPFAVGISTMTRTFRDSADEAVIRGY